MQKPYDGTYPAIHVIKQGESLSLIAQQYKIGQQPLYKYNREVEHNLGPDRDHIDAGAVITIPRSPEGYHKLIHNLRRLAMRMEIQKQRLLADLERDWYKFQGNVVLMKFADDVIITLATVGMSAIRAAGLARTAAMTVGQGRAAARYLAEQQAAKLAEAINEQFIQAFAKGLDAVDAYWSGRNAGVGETTYKTLSTAKKAINTIRGWTFQGGRALLNVTDIVLDHMEPPTNLADAYLLLTTGETTEMSYTQARQHIQVSAQHAIATLMSQVNHYQTEAKTVYG